MSRRRARVALRACVPVLAVALSGCGGDETGLEVDAAPRAPTPTSGAPPWPAPADPLERTRAAGLTPLRREILTFHVHAHLDVIVNGEAVRVPAGIGIAISDPEVKRFETPSGAGYGGIEECEAPCISPLHTHDPSGVIHTESPTKRPNRLGQFFAEWGVRLDRSCVGGYCAPAATIQVFVDGDRYSGDPADIELTDEKEIAIVVGSPPPEIPSTYDFSDA
jgi:hypothetical protein